MANTISFKLKVGDDGTFDIIVDKAKKASKATDNLGSSTDKLKKKRNDYSKQEKGVGGLTNNSTKAFAKQAQTIGGGNLGLVGIYATLMANVFALSQAFTVLNRAAGVNQLIQGLQVTGEIGGRNLEKVAKGLREISGGAVSAADAMKNVALGVSAGFSTEQMEGLARVATGASKALGRDLTDAMDRLTRGAAKLEPEILDELGIMVRLDKTTKDFADSVGKTEAEVSQFEKRMAFTNAIIEQGEKKFGDLINEVEDNPFNQLAATFTDLSHAILSVVNTAIKPLVSFLAGSPAALLGVLSLLGAMIFKQITPALSTMRDSMVENAKASALHAQQSAKSFSGLTGLSNQSRKLQQNFKSGTATLDQHAEALRTVEEKLKNNIGFHLEGSEAQKANGRDMKAVNERIKNQVKAHKELRDSLVGSITAQGQARQATASAHFESGEFLAGLKELKTAHVEGHQSYKKGTKGLSRFGKMAIFARIQSTLLAGSLKSLGLAFLSIIPFLGIILAGIQLLFGGFKKLYELFMGANPIKDAMKENKETIESLDKISDRYTSNIGEMASESERFARTAHTMAGAMDQIIEGINGIAEAEANRDKNPGLLARGLDFLTGGKSKKKREENLSGKAQSATKDFVSKSSAPLQEMLASVEGDAAATAVFTKMLADLGKLSETKTKTAFNAQMVVIKSNQQALAAYGERLQDGTKLQGEFTNEVTKLKKKAKTPYDEMNKKLKEQRKLMLNAVDADKQLNSGNFQLLETTGRILGLTDEKTGLARAATMEEAAAHNELIKQFDTNRDILAQSKSNVKLEQERLKNLEGFGGKVTSIFKMQLKQEDTLRNTKLAALTAEEALINSSEKLKEDNDRLLEIDKERAALKLAARSDNEKSLLITQSETQEMQKLNNMALQLAKTKAAILDAEQTGATLDVGLKRAKSKKAGKHISPAQAERDKLVIMKQFETERSKQRKTMLDLELKGIDFEFKLLELKTKLLIEELKAKKLINDAEAENLNKQLTIIEEQRKAARTLAETKSANEGKQAGLNILDQESTVGAVGGIAGGSAAAGGMAGGIFGMKSIGEDGTLGIPDSAFDTFGEKMTLASGMVRTFANQFKELGPEGEIISGAFENIAVGLDQINEGFEMIDAKGATTKEKVAGAFSAAAGAIGSVMGLMSAQSKMKVAGIDKEIAAEKKRDGQSAKSVALIKKMEKKKEEINKKAFETNKKLMMAQAIMSTAAAAAQALSIEPTGILMAFTIALGLAQVAIIRKMKYEGGAGESSSSAPSEINVGSRQNSIDLANSNNASGELAYMRGDSGVGNASNFKPAFTGTRYRAEGGRVGYMVGEQGPELFMPDSAGEVVSAGETEEALGGTASNVTFNINTLDASGVEDILLGQRGNIIGMIRDSANNIGEEFLEGVVE